MLGQIRLEKRLFMKIFNIFIIPVSVFIFSLFLDNKKVESHEFNKFYKNYIYGVLIGFCLSLIFLFINNFIFNSVANHIKIFFKSVFLDVPLFVLFTSFFSFVVVFDMKERLNKIFFSSFYAGIFSAIAITNSLSYNYPTMFFDYFVFFPIAILFVFLEYTILKLYDDSSNTPKKNIYIYSILYILLVSLSLGVFLYLNFYNYPSKYIYGIVLIVSVIVLILIKNGGNIKEWKKYLIQ